MSTRPEFPPHVLREYALLADGERGALCGPRGDVSWMCAPRWHDDAVFASLVGGSGACVVTPVDTYVWGGYYETGSLIWHNRWITTDTVVECQDALAFPGDPHRLVLIRRIVAPEKRVTVRIHVDVRVAFGRHPMTDLRRDAGDHLIGHSGPLRIRVSGATDLSIVDGGRLVGEVTVESGRHHDLVVEISDEPLPEPVDADQLWAATRKAWSSGSPDFATSVAPRDARQSYAVLRGLTARTGGMVAAATLGLPERAEAGRNYDYRYVWLRDQCFAAMAVAVGEPGALFDSWARFVVARVLENGDRLAPAYRIDGGDLPPESKVGLPGYPGGTDVVGNWVRQQFQLDSLGEILELLAAAARYDRLDADGVKAASIVIDMIERRWNQPDAGTWELDDNWWTHSRLACVAGLNAFAGVSPRREKARLKELADTILAETTRRCLHPRGFWRRSPEHSGTDALLLLAPVRGALEPGDPRTLATIAAVEDQLTQDGYVYRFAPDDRPLGSAEGAFLLCGFSTAMAMWQQGRTADAFRWFERTRASCGPPGLLAEEYDTTQRQLRGNLPQAFVHAMLLESAQRLSQPYKA